MNDSNVKGELVMEIERINENTVKFYISYVDIEDRGFERDEIWYDRERSEQLFWQMMDEVNYREDFHVDGPLWIQVQALDKGLEITVTKAQLSKNGEDIELPVDDETQSEMSINERIEQSIEERFKALSENENNRTKQSSDDENLILVTKFKDFEEVIQLSHYFHYDQDEIETKLYHYDNKYFLYLEFSSELDDDYQEDLLSQLFEFAENSDVTYHYLDEYGKAILTENALSQLKEYFPA